MENATNSSDTDLSSYYCVPFAFTLIIFLCCVYIFGEQCWRNLVSLVMYLTRFYFDRDNLNEELCGVNTRNRTSQPNDYSYSLIPRPRFCSTSAPASRDRRASPVRTQSYSSNRFENSSFADIAHDSLKLPNFRHGSVIGYFRSTTDLLFCHAGIHDEVVKYAKLITTLSKNDDITQSIVSVL